MKIHGSFITAASAPEKDSYLRFRKTFQWDGKGKTTLRIASCNTFAAYVNNERLKANQLSDVPEEATYSTLDISRLLKEGDNTIAVELHCIGEDFFTVSNALPFLWCEIICGGRVLACTGEDWKCSPAPEYSNGLCCKVSPQVGYVFQYDARRSLDWTQPGYDDSAWRSALPRPALPLRRRTVPQLAELPAPPVDIVQTGYLIRKKTKGTFAEISFSDFMAPCRERDFFEALPEEALKEKYVRRKPALDGSFKYTVNPRPDGTDGAYIVLDLRKETVGYLAFSITAPKGTIVDLSHGAHVEDGRVRSYVGCRNFTDRYICKNGENAFTFTHRRIAGRFLELHFTQYGSGKIAIRYAGVIPLQLPLPRETAFNSPDRLLDRINQVSIDTLRLCMHEHYEDCPWREQSLYAYDSRNQILYGYYIWGNYDFAEASLDLIGKNFDGERYTYITSPGGRKGRRIPVFTLVWISSLKEHWLHSGKPGLFKAWQRQVDFILDKVLAEQDPEFEGLYSPGDNDSRYWNFCEWNGQLQGLKCRGQAPYNIYAYEALRSAKYMHALAGNAERSRYLGNKAQELARAIQRWFWNPELKCYSHIAAGSQEMYGHIKAIMLANRLVPENRKHAILRHFEDNSLIPYDLSALQYVINGLDTCGDRGRDILAGQLRSAMEPIILSGATSLWETRQGGTDFDNAGSLCHGWSSAMPYFCKRIILGVQPVEPGFRKFRVSPYAAGLPEASGEIPTPYGSIRVSWKKKGKGLELLVDSPDGTEQV